MRRLLLAARATDRRRLLLAALTLTALAPATASAQGSAGGAVLARVDRPTPIAAYSGRVVWSQRVPGTETFQLISAFNGVTSAVPIAPRAVPFDVDLGPDAE